MKQHSDSHKIHNLKFNHLMIGLLLIIWAVGEILLTPSKQLADQDRVNLERMIPKNFAAWHQDHDAASIAAEPQVSAALRLIYNQNLVRTYVNTDGKRIMLNIAYGRNQTNEGRLHTPEACYKANGFMLSDTRSEILNNEFGPVSIKKFLGTMGSRIEPVTYWISYGDFGVADFMQLRLAKLHYIFSGSIPDGILFRVSSIKNQADEFGLHEKFINDLIASLNEQDRMSLIKKLL